MKMCAAITNANPNANVAGKDMVPEQTFQVQKIMKHGSSGPEGEQLQAASAIQCSPGMPPLWDVSMPNKGVPIHAGGYVNSFGHWYPGHHQDPMARTQMM